MNVQQQPFVHNRVIDLSGSSEVLRNNNDSKMGFGNTWSILCIWKYFANSLVASELVSIAQTSVGNRILLQCGSGNQITCETRSPANIIIKSYVWATFTGPPILPNVWQHTVLTWDGTTLQLYQNGVATAPSTLTFDNAGSMDDTARQVAVGGPISGTAGFIGQIHQAAIWNTVLSQAEVTGLYNKSSQWHTLDLRAVMDGYVSFNALMHWWLCGYPGGVGRDFGNSPFGAIDISTSALGITEVDDSTTDFPNINEYNRFQDVCLDMDGTTERLRSVAAVTISIANTWTILAWAKSFRDTTAETVFEIRSSATNTNRIRFQKRGDLANQPVEVEIYDSSGTLTRDYTFNSLMPINQWINILATWDGTTLSVWSNGQQINPTIATNTGFGSQTSTTRTIGYGGGSQADQLFQGRLHSAAIWNSVLSDSDCAIITNPYYARGLNLTKSGFGFSGTAPLHWFRAGLAPLISVANSGFVSDVATGATPIPLSAGALNLTVADIFQDAPGA